MRCNKVDKHARTVRQLRYGHVWSAKIGTQDFNVEILFQRACIDIFGTLIVPLSLLLTVPIRNKGIFQQEFIYNPHNIKQHRLPFDDAGEGDRADQHDEPGQPDQHQRRRARELRRQLHVLVQVELRPQPHHQ